LYILGSTRTPFAVKGGGYTPNPGFSSTMGVQISMTRFKDINVDPAAGTVEVGAGRTWDQVYAALEPYGITVVGARTPGVAVAGCTLGGCRRLSLPDVSNGYRLQIMDRLFLEKQPIRPHNWQHQRVWARPTKRDHQGGEFERRGSLVWVESKQISAYQCPRTF